MWCGRIFFANLGGGAIFLLFGQEAHFFFFFAFGAGNGNSHTYQPALLGANSKKTEQKKHGFHRTAATLEQPLH